MGVRSELVRAMPSTTWSSATWASNTNRRNTDSAESRERALGVCVRSYSEAASSSWSSWRSIMHTA